MKRIEKEIEGIITPILEENGMELVDVQYKREFNRWVLRIFIDKESGVNLNDCEKISKELNKSFSKVNFPYDYSLEVSSPGLDRLLKKEKDFKKFLMRRIKLTTYKPINNQKHFKAKLIGCKNEIVKIEKEQGECIEIPLGEICCARLEVEV